MSKPSIATPKDTADYRARFEGKATPDHFRVWRDLSLSSIGIGTYLGPHDDKTDEEYTEAIAEALKLGCNHIDTAINYRCMRSEQVIGLLLERLFQEGVFSRGEIFVSTKGGYIPFEGEPPVNIRSHIQSTYVETGLIDPDSLVGGCHTLDCRFLESQITKSLENLRLETIDLYYVHNPEVHAAVTSRREFRDGLRKVFSLLEKEVSKGRIARYGISSWEAFRTEPSKGAYLSLEEICTLAKEVAGEKHHLAAIQLPFNAAMMEGYALPAQQVDDENLSSIDAAVRLGLLLVASAPLVQARFLKQFPGFLAKGMKNLDSNAEKAIQFARSIPGITTVLVGMSKQVHVAENLDLCRHPPLTEDELFALFE